MKRNGVILLLAGFVFAFYLLVSPEGASETPKSQSVAVKSHAFSATEAALSPLSLLTVKLPSLDALREAGTKVLFSAREREDLISRLSDRGNVNEAASALLRVNSRFDKKEEQGRLQAVDFLVTALLTPENPDRQYAVRMAAEVISSENVFETKDLSYRKSLVGDKLELYQALAKADASAAQQIFDKAQGSALAKIMRFVKGSSDFKAGLSGG